MSEKRALVLELGSRYVRAGVSEERAPRHTERWEMAELLQTPRPTGEWRELLYPKLHAICFERLLVNPARRRVVVCEDLLSPRAFREALLRVLFEDLKAAAVTLVPSILTALHATATHSALVVDCGWAETRVLPVFKGLPLQHLYRTIPNGSKTCCEALRSALATASAAPIAQLTAEDEPLSVAVADADFQTGTSQALSVPAELRASAVECLFAGDTVDCASIPEGVRHVVMKAPIDVRAAALSNVVLIGGTAMIPGLATRLADEIADALRQDAHSAVLADRVRLVRLHFPRNMLSWVGASVFAATESARAAAVSASAFAAAGSCGAPGDWLSVA